MITVGNIYAGLNQSGGGGAVITANGISGDGSVGTPVILGGNPLIQGTVLALGGNEFTISDSLGPDDIEITVQAGAFEWQYGNNVSGSFASVFGGNSSGMGSLIEIAVNDGALNEKRIDLDTEGGSGIVVTDEIDVIGLNGSALFPVSGDGRQYAQYGNIPAPSGLPVTPFSANAESADLIIIDFSTFISQIRAYRITAALFATIGGGATVQLFVDYTSFDTTPRTVELGPALILTGDAAYPPLTLICFTNTDIIVRAVVVDGGGGANYDVIGVIEDLGTF